MQASGKVQSARSIACCCCCCCSCSCAAVAALMSAELSVAGAGAAAVQGEECRACDGIDCAHSTPPSMDMTMLLSGCCAAAWRTRFMAPSSVCCDPHGWAGTPDGTEAAMTRMSTPGKQRRSAPSAACYLAGLVLVTITVKCCCCCCAASVESRPVALQGSVRRHERCHGVAALACEGFDSCDAELKSCCCHRSCCRLTAVLAGACTCMAFHQQLATLLQEKVVLREAFVNAFP